MFLSFVSFRVSRASSDRASSPATVRADCPQGRSFRLRPIRQTARKRCGARLKWRDRGAEWHVRRLQQLTDLRRQTVRNKPVVRLRKEERATHQKDAAIGDPLMPLGPNSSNMSSSGQQDRSGACFTTVIRPAESERAAHQLCSAPVAVGDWSRCSLSLRASAAISTGAVAAGDSPQARDVIPRRTGCARLSANLARSVPKRVAKNGLIPGNLIILSLPTCAAQSRAALKRMPILPCLLRSEECGGRHNQRSLCRLKL
jgi:hypothetical protein